MYKTPVVILIILIIGIIVPIYNKTVYFMIDKTNYKLTDIKDIKFRTGDILIHTYNENLLTYDNVNKITNINLKNLNKELLKSGWLLMESPKQYLYIHVAIIFVINNTPYIYQISLLDKSNHKYIINYLGDEYDIRMPNLLDINYLNHYKGHIHHYSYIGDDIPESKIKDFMINNKNIKIGHNFLLTYLDKSYNHDEKYLCTGFLAKILNDLDIHKFDNYYNKNQGDIFNDVILHGNKYKKNPNIINNYYMNYHQ